MTHATRTALGVGAGSLVVVVAAAAAASKVTGGARLARVLLLDPPTVQRPDSQPGAAHTRARGSDTRSHRAASRCKSRKRRRLTRLRQTPKADYWN